MKTIAECIEWIETPPPSGPHAEVEISVAYHLRRVEALEAENARLRHIAAHCGLAISHGMECSMSRGIDDQCAEPRG